jgi:ADP-ribosyl-[dinitrogen reductase] hydrolase
MCRKFDLLWQRMMWSYKMRSILGALVGDAAGATLEFFRGNLTETKVREAMRMPGGGCLGVGPGQITDDGELTLALWGALQNKEYDHHEAIIRAYADWYNSRPFDIGRTCANAFAALNMAVQAGCTEEAVDAMYDMIDTQNAESEANGALMRATAIPTFAKSIGEARSLSDLDCGLSHPNQVCCDANRMYVSAIWWILNGKTPQEALELLTDQYEFLCATEEVKHWFAVDSLNIDELDCRRCMGHVRYAFTLAMYFLRNPDISYEEAIFQTLCKGGDTDTNAAIVGGLVGSYQPIPEYMADPVLTFDCQTPEHLRPTKYGAKYVLGSLRPSTPLAEPV